MRVVGLWRFPVKSFGGESVERIAVGEHGFDHDRHWGLRDLSTGKILTARREPKLLFASGTTDALGELHLQLPDGHRDVTEWLGYPVEIVRATPGVRGTFENPLDAEHESDWMEWQGPDGVFHDSKRTQVSLVSLTTLGAWDLRRFRTNVIFDEGDENEFIGRRLRIGGCELDVVKAVDRCVMVSRPQPGLDRDLDVLRTINRQRGGNLAVGALVTAPGVICVGDEVVGPASRPRFL